MRIDQDDSMKPNNLGDVYPSTPHLDEMTADAHLPNYLRYYWQQPELDENPMAKCRHQYP